MAILVTKENWPEVKKDFEEHGVGRMNISDDGKMVRINSLSFTGYDFPLRFIRKLQKDGELPEELLRRFGKV